MSIKKRLEKLEAAAKIPVAKFAVTEIILMPGGETSGAAWWCYPSNKFVSVSDEDTKEIKDE